MADRWIDDLTERLRRQASDWVDGVTDAYSVTIEQACESPIEKLLISQFAYMSPFLYYPGHFALAFSAEAETAEADLKALSARIYFDRRSQSFGKWTGMVYPQAPRGRFRLDFLFGAVFCDPSQGFPVKFLAVECDGHDFHERTKEQAARDRSRDRFLQSQGLPVFRFTGSQIHADPWQCREEIMSFFDDWARPYEDKFHGISCEVSP